MQYIIETVETKPLSDMKQITFGVDPQPSTKEEFDQLISQALQSVRPPIVQELIQEAWQLLHSGNNITIGNKILYCKR